MKHLWIVIVTIIATLIIGGAVLWSNPYLLTQFMHHGMQGHGQHDEINMPMLNGVDTTDQEVSDLRTLFQNHMAYTRTVENLPNGIRTVTETNDPALRDVLVNHVSDMVTRLGEQRDPQVPIQSRELAPLFISADKIDTQMEVTDTGIIVIQTSDDPAIVQHLQNHASDVTDLVDRGMRAVHENMMGGH